MVFKSTGARTYKCKVRDLTGRRATLSTGTRNEKTAKAVERFARLMRDQFRQDVLGPVFDGALTLAEAYQAHAEGRLDQLLATLRAASDAEANDLRRYLDPWEAWKRAAKSGAAQAGRYRREVERLYADGAPLTKDTFVPRELAARIAAVKGSEATRSRHKAAAMSFGAYLVLEGVLSHNPVRDTPAMSPGAKRTVWYDRATAQAVLARLPQPYAAMEALMCALGMEWRAVTLLRARDVQYPIVYARGTKTAHRARQCVWLEDNAWAWGYVREWLAEARPLGDARVFSGFVAPQEPGAPGFDAADKVAGKRALAAHRAACEAAGARDSTLHDWRHSFAVQALRDGYRPSAIARNLGHATTQQVTDRYGVHVPELEDYRPRTGRTDKHDHTYREARS